MGIFPFEELDSPPGSFSSRNALSSTSGLLLHLRGIAFLPPRRLPDGERASGPVLLPLSPLGLSVLRQQHGAAGLGLLTLAEPKLNFV